MSKKKISYKEAVSEIEEILEHLESEDLDVDDLSDKVKRVSELIRICREKLTKTEQDVVKVLNEIED